MAKPVFVLVDCDNFFVSCERVFRPDLAKKLVIVLSNNDSCVVARSNEVKSLGIPMGIPQFKVKDDIAKHQIVQFSANFGLYGDFSQRVVNILSQVSPRVEVYSVDESFLEIGDLPIDNYREWATELRQKIKQWIGIPVSIGIAPSKTLAKAAAEKAKRDQSVGGVFSLVSDKHTSPQAADERRVKMLQSMAVGEVWGVGWQLAPRLRDKGISTAWALSQVSHDWARDQLTVRGLAMVQELQGQSYYGLEDSSAGQKTLMVTRTFPHRLQTWHHLEGQVASFAAKAAAKLRRFQQISGVVTVFVAGDRHRDEQNYRRVSTVVPLLQATNDTGEIISAALAGLKTLYDAEYSYRRAGVGLLDLAPESARQLSWLAPVDATEQIDRKARLMQAMDGLNDKYHTTLMWHAAEQRGSVAPHRGFKSPAYTTRWAQLPVVKS